MFTYEFKLTTGDMNVGTVYLPNKESKNLSTIIYCHGWGGSRNLWLPTEMLCEKAMELNMAFVTFDFYGGGETGGDYNSMTYTRWKNNLSDIFSWCIGQSFANAEKIGFYSFSSGSTAALRLATEEHRIVFVISVGTCISSHIFMRTGGPAKWLADNLQLLISGGTFKDFGIDFLVDTVSNAPIYTVNQIKCPTLFLQGLADNPYRCADARMAHQLRLNEDLPTTLVEIQNGNHELENVIDEALNIMVNWLNLIKIS